MAAGIVTMRKGDRTPQQPGNGEESGVEEDWVRTLDEYGVRFLVLDRHRDSALSKLLRAQPRWKLEFEDGEVVLFVHAGTG